MAVSDTKTKRRAAVRKKSRSAPTKNATRRRRRIARRNASKKRWSLKLGASRQDDLPGWKDLAANNDRTPTRRPLGTLAERVSTLHFALLLVVLAGSVTLYVGHVHATQELLAEVQRARRENQRLHLKLDRLRGEFDRATGPAVVYRRAHELGLEEGIAYGPTIRFPHND